MHSGNDLPVPLRGPMRSVLRRLAVQYLSLHLVLGQRGGALSPERGLPAGVLADGIRKKVRIYIRRLDSTTLINRTADLIINIHSTLFVFLRV